MTPEEYQRLASRTECNQWNSRDRMLVYRPYADVHDSRSPDKLIPIRVTHALIGMMGEVGELSAALEHWIYYGNLIDMVNCKEELGDLLWYVAQLCNALDLELGEVMEANIRKLKERYPEKYSDELAKEENRDRAAEREALNG